MRPPECLREQDVLDALAARRWPARSDEELRLHVASCDVCTDLLQVVQALLNEAEADEVTVGVSLPPASVVWWRAQLRARQDAARAAARPLHLTFRVAMACFAAVLILGVMTFAPQWQSLLPASDWTLTLDPRAARDAALAALATRGVQLAAVAWLVLGPVALYLAFAKD